MDSETKQEAGKVRKFVRKYSPFVLELVKIAIIAFVIVAPIRYFLFQPFIVSGASMAPNFATGDYLIIDEISYRFAEPQRGDVVVFDASFIKGYEGQRFIKRVVGLPGETINITNGKVEIIQDGKTTILNEKYLSQIGGDILKTYGYVNVTLMPGQYFVLGDNREYSYDSRMWGVVSRQYIIGKAALRIFPITTISEINRPTY
ncbi:MAG: signal peptidase I [Candidatus Staskawiczbacteria bacterium]|nr:signal peptidase I [Candidatus Staskawiczbacteria bacterium]